MTNGESSKSQALLYEGMDEREHMPRDAQQPPSLSSSYNIQKESHCFWRTITKIRSKTMKHVFAGKHHREKDEEATTVRRNKAVNLRPDEL